MEQPRLPKKRNKLDEPVPNGKVGRLICTGLLNADMPLIRPDGRRIGRLDPVFKADLHIREAQIIQETLERLRVKLVPALGYTEDDAKVIIQRLRDRVGDMEIVLETVDQIPREANGKFRAVISQLSVSKQVTKVEH